MQTIDEQLLDESSTTPGIVFGKVRRRIGALLLDGLILSPLTGLTLYNMFVLKSPYLFIGLTLAALVYKPLMEYYFGYTLGKKILKLRVVDTDLEKPSFIQIMQRNVFHLAPSLVSFVPSLLMFYDPGFQATTSYMEYVQYSQANNKYQPLTSIAGIVYVLDGIVAWRDPQKRSLHDKWAKTWVIQE